MCKIPGSLAVLCSLVIAGCASNPPLKSLEGQEQVTLEFVNLSPSKPTTLMLYGDDYDCFGLGLVSYGADDLSRTTRTLLKRRYQTVTFQYLGAAFINSGLASTSCAATFSFETAEAGNYRISLVDEDDHCRVKVDYLPAGAAENPQQLELKTRTYSAPAIDSSGPWCLADPKFLGSSGLMTPRKVGGLKRKGQSEKGAVFSP